MNTPMSWTIVLFLIVATITTIDVQPYLVFNPPPMDRMATGTVALLLGLAAALTAEKKPKA